ncbi:MAG: hypothetical protein FWG65_07920 [Turicibacter sp.]|nr:hypothetical protein [Turicibacter sp.]
MDDTVRPPAFSANILAYMGDAVFELYVRQWLILAKPAKIFDLNELARSFVCATSQAKMYHHIKPFLSEDELTIMKRGRNLHSQKTAEYRHATGLEALFGYLFLNNDSKRLQEVFELCLNQQQKTQEKEDLTGNLTGLANLTKNSEKNQKRPTQKIGKTPLA